VGLLLGLAGCATEEPSSGPYSGLLITVDTTRADALSCYGRFENLTPAMDRLAEGGVLYESAHTVAPLTLPAHASMLTGLYPVRHTVRVNGMWALPESADSLAEAARDAGLQTGAFIASLVLDDTFGLDQGFDTYGTPGPSTGPLTSEYPERDANEVIDEAIAWLRERDPDRRFFAWVHLFDPHYPPKAPDPLPFSASSPIWQGYLGEVARMDREIDRLLGELDDLGLEDETFVLLVGDHGESLGEHGEPTHSMYCNEAVLRVPLLLSYPDGYRAGERSQENVSVVDVNPTMMHALGLNPAASIDGLSLFRSTVPDDRGVYFESYTGFVSYGWSQMAGWLDAQGKYVHTSSTRLYDLDRDPEEIRNLLEAEGGRGKEYREAIAKVAARPALAPEVADVDPNAMQGIRNLGYGFVGDSGETPPHPLEPSALPCPFDRVEDFRRISEAQACLSAGQAARALALVESIVREGPDNPTAIETISSALVQSNRFAEAIPYQERLVRMRPSMATNHRNLSFSLRKAGRVDEAIVRLWEAIQLDPSNARFSDELMWILRDRPEEADAYARRLRELRGGE